MKQLALAQDGGIRFSHIQYVCHNDSLKFILHIISYHRNFVKRKRQIRQEF